MTLKQIASLGTKLTQFLAMFADCFHSQPGRNLLRVFVHGQMSDLPHKTAETIAMQSGTRPRTLQRFFESIKWDEEKVIDRCQVVVAEDHAHPEAIGVIDESGIAKSGKHTVGVSRQWCGNKGKVDNSVVAVHTGYSAPGFQCLLDSRVYLPEEWANDPDRRKQNYVPEDVEFQTKPEMASDQIDRALSNGIRVKAWTFDELYGRDNKFLDRLEQQKQVFVGEIPVDFHGWLRKPRILRFPRKKQRGRAKAYPRLARRRPSCEVRNLVTYSPVFREQSWRRYRIKDTGTGPQVWEIKWAPFWRKGENGLPGRRHCLIVARNVLTGEMKYFLANRVPGEPGVTLRWLLRTAFQRWSIERDFRIAKHELGMNDFQVRGWQCVHRHYVVTQLSYLFCARIRQEYDTTEDGEPNNLTIEQVHRAVNTWLSAVDLPPAKRQERYEKELQDQQYYQRRSQVARVSHTKTTILKLRAIGIDADCIKSCVT